jgi:hypothetical protein
MTGRERLFLTSFALYCFPQGPAGLAMGGTSIIQLAIPTRGCPAESLCPDPFRLSHYCRFRAIRPRIKQDCEFQEAFNSPHQCNVCNKAWSTSKFPNVRIGFKLYILTFDAASADSSFLTAGGHNRTCHLPGDGSQYFYRRLTLFAEPHLFPMRPGLLKHWILPYCVS